jgi:hypothetical protein
MRNCTIPFSGFYYSLHDSELDLALEQEFSDSNGNENPGLTSRAFDCVNWRAVHVEYSKAYAEAFAEEFEIQGLQFESLQSPREYNFTTDRIFVNIPAEEIERIYTETPRATLESVAAEWFTSRSGFSSFYSPNVDDWGDLSTWDHNQLGALIAAYVLHRRGGEPFDEYSLCEDFRCNGYLSNWLFSDCQPELHRIARVGDYLRQREERNWS